MPNAGEASAVGKIGAKRRHSAKKETESPTLTEPLITNAIFVSGLCFAGKKFFLQIQNPIHYLLDKRQRPRLGSILQMSTIGNSKEDDCAPARV
jgi:hypothetical protein